ncbi:Hypothetical protein R9X50_00136800 [Acrodontium crateriforme]|uniref:DUF8035 domain-containing protein n=1 Tax=Acrodontium crateriforme TaxID=150365 RepID=A0AAQ3M513_9PEZI|nr:Hypothetical protein R9X50_00136800 [Acrodontium crateriforme]
MQQEKEKKEKKRLEMKKKEDAKKSTTNDPPNDMWTQITKDLVSKEAIEAKGYLYSEEKDSFYVHKYLPYHDVSELADMTAQIKAGQLLHHERSSEVNQKILSSNEPARPQVVEVKVDPIEGVSLSVAPSSTRLEEHDLALETALWEDTQSRKSQTPDFHTVKPRDRPKSSQRPRSGGNNVLSWLGGKNYREKKDFERPSAASQSGGISPLPKVNTHDSSERSQLDKRIKSSGQDITASRSKPFPPMAEEAHSLSSSNLMMANTSPPAPTPPRETRVETSKRGRPEASRSDAATYDAGKAARNKNSISPINRKNLDPSVETLWSRKDQNLPTIDDFDEIDALIDPISYFAELDQLEIDVAEKCHLKAIFPQALPHLRNIDKGAGLYSNSQEITIASGDIVRDHCRTVLYGILAALELMKLQGFCGESIEILVEDADRSNVTRVVDISIAQVLELRRVIELEANDTLALTKEFTFGILALFGARTRLSTYSETGSNDSSVGEVVSLLCSLLALATVSYAGSHCHDIGQIVWSSSLDYITFDNAYTRSGKNLQFYRRPLACLKDFVGGPVWVFGSRDSTESLLSTTITQFSDLWGPLIAIPSNEGFKELLMIQSEAGVLFQTKDSALARSQAKDEVLIHWISCEPPRKARKLLDKIKISSKKGEKLPTKLIPFSANARLLIGHPPPPSGASCTVTSNTPGLSLNTQGGIRVNNFCQFDLDRFQLENEANLHLIGTWDESYVPDQLQLALTAGQYVNVGIQKVWKRRPGCTQKARLLLALSNPRIRPTNLEKILQLSIGYEQSACTGNAKRVTLQQSLLGAYPSVAPLIERACDNHDAPYLLEFIVELSFTGLDANGHLSLFWPFNDGQDALELTDSKPTWKDFLKDTRDESCFAFISPRCLTYTGSDELKSRRIRMLCSCRHGNSDRPVFQTAIELDPKAKVRLPLEIEARIRLADGFLEIRNDDAVQLAAYGRRGLLSRLEELAICARDGQMGHQHRESMTAGIRPSRNTVPVCIVDR